MGYQICIDIGGTFTDCLVADPQGDIRIFKAPTTPGEFHKGFVDVLSVAAEGYGFSALDFNRQIDVIVHGSTVSTNALVERKVAKTGLILNHGHQDILLLREGPRKGAFEWKLDFPEPYIPQRLTRTVRGRIDARGTEIEGLDEAALVRIVADFKRLGVESIAVGLLWSVVNHTHEVRVRELIHGLWPEVHVSLSHEINPLPREYKRIIAAAIDASISPVIRRYINDLQAALSDAAFGGELLLANCVGGMMPAAEMLRRPIYSVMSGPTLAPIAALSLTDEADIVVGDMGGTTFDVSALRDHQVIISPDAVIHDDVLGIPKVDVRSVGAGGGSLAWVDTGGMLQVGPQSAGARPGPACYGLGNDQATVTDANLVMGILDPEFFLGGRYKLDRARSVRAVEEVASKLGVSTDAAAYAIYTTSNHNMVAAIEDITIREGINPRDSYFICGGGGTSAHIAEMVNVLGITRYMIPRFVAGLSAFGGLISDIRWEESGTFYANSQKFDVDRVNVLLKELKATGQRFLNGARIGHEQQRFEYFFMGRYEYQSWEIQVQFDGENDLTLADLGCLVESFHQMHERIYNIRSDADLVEFTAWKVRAVGSRGGADALKKLTVPRQSGPVQEKSMRSVYFGAQDVRRDVPVYDGAAMGAGAQVSGPCLIETPTFTALLLDKHRSVVDDFGNYLVHVTD